MAPPSAAACRGADAYVTLGITRQATDGEVKQAYRRLALRSHPDKMPEDAKESATQRFQEIQAAYEALSPSKRKQYDAGGPGGRVRGKLSTGCRAREGAHGRLGPQSTGGLDAQGPEVDDDPLSSRPTRVSISPGIGRIRHLIGQHRPQ